MITKALGSQAEGDRYSYLECGVDTELTLLIKEEGNGGLHEQNKHHIKKPRSALLEKPQRILNPPPLMEEDEFKKVVGDKLMGFLGKKLRKMEEAEKRRREEVLNGAEFLNSLKNATPYRVVCDQKQEKTEMPSSSSSSHPQPQQKKIKGITFVGRDQSLLPLQSKPPEMPLKIKEAITLLGGTPPVWLTQKTLTQSDVDHYLGRLFIPPCEALEQFLTNEEKRAAWVEQKAGLVSKKKKHIKNKELVKEEKKKKVIGLNVILVNPMGDWQEVSFRIWGSLRKCVLTKTWKSIVEKFDLKPDRDTVQLWCFRLPVERDSKLCFAMNIIRIVQLGDEELDADQPRKRKRAISNCIEPSFDNFEARP